MELILDMSKKHIFESIFSFVTFMEFSLHKKNVRGNSLLTHYTMHCIHKNNVRLTGYLNAEIMLIPNCNVCSCIYFPCNFICVL